MLPHPHIHSRHDHHALIGGHEQRGGQIIGMAPGHFRHKVRRRRRDDNQVCRAAKLDVAHLCFIRQIKQIAIDFRGRQCGCRQGRDELFCCARQYWRHRCAPFAQPADKIEGLEGGYASADYQQYAFAMQHEEPFPGALGQA